MAIYALDVRTSAVDIAAVTETGNLAAVTTVRPAPGRLDGSVAAEWNRSAAMTSGVMEHLHKHPMTVVCLTRPLWSTPAKDITAHRRAGLWWSIVEALLKEQVPVVEIAATATLAWCANGTRDAAPGVGTLAELSAYADRYFPDVASPKEATDFRRSVLMTAAMTAMCFGAETPVPVTENRIATLNTNRAIRWTKRVPAIPRTVEAWHDRNTLVCNEFGADSAA